jgi:CubicO group peptidase (beta-lactamase class C family)
MTELPRDTERLTRDLDALAARTGFCGAVRVDGPDGLVAEAAYGQAHRGYGIPNAVGTRFAIASGTKSYTALAVVSLIDDGTLSLSTTARSLLGPDLPLVADDVTIEHLLAHRSGIGDYFDEDLHPDVDEYVMPIPVHQLDSAESYLAVLDGHPTVSRAGERFAYNNGGYVVLAILAERASGTPYHDLVLDRVCRRAGLAETGFPRADEPIGNVARGYLATPNRENIFHLPLRGVGDGGITTTVADVRALWAALFDGRIVSHDWVDEMVRPHGDAADEGRSYGLGFWLHPSSGTVVMEGMDAGISFQSLHARSSQVTLTIVSNTSDGAWPVATYLEEQLG